MSIHTDATVVVAPPNDVSRVVVDWLFGWLIYLFDTFRFCLANDR